MCSATTIAGIVAHQRGCPDTWPKPDTIRAYVSLTSVKAVLQVLAEEGKVFPTPGDHWSIVPSMPKVHTYYLTPEQRDKAIQEHSDRYLTKLARDADAQAKRTLAKFYEAEYLQLVEDYSKARPEPDWRADW
jgi:hypothetical protein